MPALITRCPACATMFKVVPDQLRVSEGWVRCGHCGEVFDASGHLQPSAAVEQEQEAQSGASVQPLQPAPDPSPIDAGLPPSPARESLDERAAEAGEAFPAPDPESEPDQAPDSVASPQTEIDEELIDDEPDSVRLLAEQQALREDPLDQPFSLRREDLSAPAELAGSGLPGNAAAPLEEPTFIRQARREARWQRPAMRGLLSVLALACAGLLGLQVAVQERDRLAATEPALRPWLARLCEPVGCRIAPPRRIEAIAIDGSTFNRLRTDAYRLHVTLRNQSGTQVAMPAVELTLTDSEEQPVVRRVLMPGELGAPRLALAARAEWSGTAAVALQDPSLAGRVAGYRVLAFYP